MLTLSPDGPFIDRLHPALVTLDDAMSVVNLDDVLLAGDPGSVRVREAYDPFTQTCVDLYIADRADVAAETSGRYVPLGTSDGVCRERLGASTRPKFVAADASEALVDVVTSTFDETFGRLEEQFGVPVAPAPTLVLAHDRDAEDASYETDLGWRSTVFLHYRSAGSDAFAEADEIEIRRTLAHELVHLWIGRKLSFERLDGRERPWLREGAAEYIALLELERTGVLSRAALAERLARAADSCARGLPGRSLLGPNAPVSGQLVDDCGVLVQLVYDAMSRRDASNPRTLVEIWGALLEAAGPGGRARIAPARFLGQNTAAREALGGILDGGRVDLETLAAMLDDAGIRARVEQRADSGDGPTRVLRIDDLAYLGN